MRVLTEAALREIFKNKIPSQYYVDQDIIITPSAKQYLKEKKVELIIGKKEEEIKKNVYEPLEIPDERIIPKYKSYEGGAFEKKPEHMTQLYKNILVSKDHPRIVLRGKLDSFQSQILELQVFAHQKKMDQMLNELNEILNFVRDILKAEVLEETLKEFNLLGLSPQELRDQSHQPKKYFGIDHIFPSYEMGEILIKLNTLRSSSREVEILAIKAFKREYEVDRLDIIKALNRLSSVIYIMMCKFKAGLYQ
ncbi:cobalamin adenosyltransferase [Anaerophilus nitritogenes]|uniref:cobalamin adenosyltransferase n=1 Tax=Anaerophilus nitritogenes TaxID=2498136 RepID=UPI00101C2121|nr:cobalamin adenosyltransferase [Anaerophilus nitritogenes]